MSRGDFYVQGRDRLKHAISLDQGGVADTKQVVDAYRVACEFLTGALELETDRGNQQSLLTTIQEALARAELLRSLPPPAPVVTTTAAAAAATPPPSLLPPMPLQPQPHVQATKLEKKLSWDDVVGLDKLRHLFITWYELPLLLPSLVKTQSSTRGLLMYGPPGTGKTQVARVIASQLDAEFFTKSAADLVSKFMGESEKHVKELFAAARAVKPRSAIIFFDEFDALATRRGGDSSDGSHTANERLVTQFLNEIDGVTSNNENLCIITATNRPWALDDAILRRFGKKIHIGLPDTEARIQLLRKALSKHSHALQESEGHFESLAACTKGYSGSDIVTMVEAASNLPMNRLVCATKFYSISNGPWNPVASDTTLVPSKGITIESLDWRAFGAGGPREGQLDPTCAKITMEDVTQALATSKASSDTRALTQYKQWTRAHGETHRDSTIADDSSDDSDSGSGNDEEGHNV